MRRLIAFPLVAAILLAACGSSTTTPAATGAGPDGSASASASAASTAVPSGSSPVGASSGPAVTPGATDPAGDTGPIPPDASAGPELPATPAPSQTAACAKLNAAIGTIDLYLQFFTSVDRTTWADMTGPESPIQFDRKDFTAAIATLAKVRGTGDAVASLREIDRVLGIALSLKDPFAPGVLTGPRLVQLANDRFVPIETALVAARTTTGCPTV